MTLPVLASILAEIDQGRRSSNVGAAVAGFALLALWILVAIAQVVRQRRQRRRTEQPADSAGDE